MDEAAKAAVHAVVLKHLGVCVFETGLWCVTHQGRRWGGVTVTASDAHEAPVCRVYEDLLELAEAAAEAALAVPDGGV